MKHIDSSDSFYKDYIKASRRGNRKEFGFEPEKIHSSHKAYHRQKMTTRQALESSCEY